MEEWDETIPSVVKLLSETSRLAKNCMNEDESDNVQQEINDIIKQYCVLDIKRKYFNEALRKTEEYFTDAEENSNTTVEVKLESFLKKKKAPAENMIANHPYMVQYLKEQEIDNAMEKSVLDEETAEFAPPTDPITKDFIRNPVRNTQCGHLYDDESIRTLIRKKNTRCPYIGCPAVQYIKVSDLVLDEALKKKICLYFRKNE